MTQIAPGRYTAFQPAGLGTYWLDAQIRRDGKLLDTARGAAAVLSMPETVGKPDGSIEVAEKPGLRTVMIWPWLLGFAAVVLVLDFWRAADGAASRSKRLCHLGVFALV